MATNSTQYLKQMDANAVKRSKVPMATVSIVKGLRLPWAAYCL